MSVRLGPRVEVDPRPTRQLAARRSRRTFGKIRRLPSGRYQASYIGETGQRYVGPTTFELKMDADAWLSMMQASMTEHRWKPPVPSEDEPESPTLREYSATWLRNRRTRYGEGLKPRTVDLYRGLLDKHILPIFGDWRLVDITPEDVDDWYDQLLPESPTRRSHTYALLSSIMRTAASGRRRLITANPCQVERPFVVARKFEPDPATPEEVAVIVEEMPEKYRALILLAAWCGLRWGEVSELRRKDLDLKAMTVRVDRAVIWQYGKPVVTSPKSRAGIRTVAIPPNLKKALKHHLEEHALDGPNGLLFPNAARTGHLHINTVSKTFHKARVVAGRPELRFHDLRHGSATMAAQAGATLAELMARLGHLSMSTRLGPTVAA